MILDCRSNVVSSPALVYIPISHVYGKHREELLFLQDGDSKHSTEDDSQHNGVLISDNPGDIINSQPTIHSGGDSLKLNAAKFLLKTKECKLMQASLDAIVSGVKGLWSQAMDDLKEKMQDVVPETCNAVFDDSIFTASPFDGLETQYFTGRTSATL